MPRKKSDAMYDEYLEVVRKGLIKRFNKNKQSMKYIKNAILRENTRCSNNGYKKQLVRITKK